MTLHKYITLCNLNCNNDSLTLSEKSDVCDSKSRLILGDPASYLRCSEVSVALGSLCQTGKCPQVNILKSLQHDSHLTFLDKRFLCLQQLNSFQDCCVAETFIICFIPFHSLIAPIIRGCT